MLSFAHVAKQKSWNFLGKDNSNYSCISFSLFLIWPSYDAVGRIYYVARGVAILYRISVHGNAARSVAGPELKNAV